MSRLIESLHRNSAVDHGPGVAGSLRYSISHSNTVSRPPRTRHAATRAVRRPHFLEPEAVAADEQDGCDPVVALDRGARNAAALGLDRRSLAAFADLHSRLLETLDQSQPLAICCTSALPGEGKTAVSLDLAFVAANDPERRVLVIDANLSSPQAAQRLGMSSKVGLGEILADGVHPSEAIVHVESVGFDLIAAGSNTPRAVELVSSRRMGVLLRDLKRSYDLILVDVPHVSPDSIAQFGVGFDAVFLVVQMQWTGRRAIETALDLLEQAGCTPNGCILVGEVAGQRKASPASAVQPPHFKSRAIIRNDRRPSAESTVSNLASYDDEEVRTESEIAEANAAAEHDESGFEHRVQESVPGAFEDIEYLQPDSDPAATPTIQDPAGDTDEHGEGIVDLLRELECNEPVEQVHDPLSAFDESDAETLRRLETFEPPFDGEIFNQADDVALPPLPTADVARDEDRSRMDGETAASSATEDNAGDPRETTTDDVVAESGDIARSARATEVDVAALFEADNLIAREPQEEPSVGHEKTLRPNDPAGVRGALGLRLSRVSSGLETPNGLSAAARFHSNDPWAANVLAISGLMLLAATILYLAGDVLLWF
jgi:Mrp family chromosome partitioning ATPase